MFFRPDSAAALPAEVLGHTSNSTESIRLSAPLQANSHKVVVVLVLFAQLGCLGICGVLLQHTPGGSYGCRGLGAHRSFVPCPRQRLGRTHVLLFNFLQT